MDYDVTKFKLAPYAITFKGQPMGGTDGPPKLSIKPKFYESKCDQAGDTILRKIIIGYEITVTASLKEIDPAMEALLGDGGKITMSDVGKDLLQDAGALSLVAIGDADQTSYNFPAAILLPETEYEMAGTEDHKVPFSWTITPDENGIFMERSTK